MKNRLGYTEVISQYPCDPSDLEELLKQQLDLTAFTGDTN